MGNWLKAFLNLIFPPRCEACGSSSEEPLCQKCFKSIKFMRPQMGIHAVAVYEGALREAIHKFKFKKKKRLAEPLGILMTRYLSSIATLNLREMDLIIPVPLHPKKLRQRGFNQVELLARIIQRYHELKVATEVLVRAKDTKSQFDLKPEERKVNISGAFKVLSHQEVQGRNILLVDDIYTTGSTIAECVKVLKLAGAKRIEVLALSRATGI